MTFPAARLGVREEQRAFLDSPAGILARGYAYRKNRARVIGIAVDEDAPDCLNLMHYFH